MTTKGIQYFPLDVNFFEDDKIAVIINDYGFEAVGVTLKLFSQIYKNGFYMNWNDKTCKVFTASFRSSFSSTKINRLVRDLVKEFVFEPILFKKYQILTSKTIQKNYFEAVCRRKNFDIEDVEYLLMEIPVSKMNRKNVCKNEEIACKNAKNVDIFQQRREEKNREEKSKEETTTSSRAREDEKSIICYFWLDPKVTKRSRLRLLRYSLPALRCSHRKLASLKQRCSRTLRYGRSFNAHQPRPILSSLAFGIRAPHHIFSSRQVERSEA